MLPVSSLTHLQLPQFWHLSLSMSVLPLPLNYILRKYTWGLLHPSFPTRLSPGIVAVRKIAQMSQRAMAEKFTTPSQVFCDWQEPVSNSDKQFETRCQMLLCRGSKGNSTAVKAVFGSRARFRWTQSPSSQLRAETSEVLPCAAQGKAWLAPGMQTLSLLGRGYHTCAALGKSHLASIFSASPECLHW